jgi:hypothetical protein|mmetsp:Transcript_15720/g.18661  ORF Transcript_15720/g.18661 Transcript_15720/m.18661 type:complete len:216 (-) Transcript_15720:1240-1887(-)
MVLDSDTVEPFSFAVVSVLLLLLLLGGKALKIMFDVNRCSAFVGVHRDVAEGERGAAFGHRRWHVAAIKLTHRVARGLHVASIVVVHRVGSEVDAQVESVAMVVAQVEAVGVLRALLVVVYTQLSLRHLLHWGMVVDVLVDDVVVQDGVVDVLVDDVLVVDEAVVGVVLVGVFVVSALNNDIVVWVAVVGDQSAAVVVTGELNRVRVDFRDRSDE